MGRTPAMLTARDGYVLEKMLRDWPPLTEEWLVLLKRKLASGCRPAGERVPADLATIDARVTFRCESGLIDTRTLCLPGTHAPGSAFLPITTFYGLALLGLHEGQAMTFERPEGRRDWIVLEKVLFQPAAGGPVPETSAEALRQPFRVIAGGLTDRAFTAANENGPGPGPGPSAA